MSSKPSHSEHQHTSKQTKLHATNYGDEMRNNSNHNSKNRTMSEQQQLGHEVMTTSIAGVNSTSEYGRELVEVDTPTTSLSALQSYSRIELMELMRQHEQQQEKHQLQDTDTRTNSNTKRSLRTLIGKEASLRKPFVIVAPNNNGNNNTQSKRTKMNTSSTVTTSTSTWIPPLPLPTSPISSPLLPTSDQYNNHLYQSSSAFQPVTNNNNYTYTNQTHPEHREVVRSFQDISLRPSDEEGKQKHRSNNTTKTTRKHRLKDDQLLLDVELHPSAGVNTTFTQNPTTTVTAKRDKVQETNMFDASAILSGVHPSRRLDLGIDDSSNHVDDRRYISTRKYYPSTTTHAAILDPLQQQQQSTESDYHHSIIAIVNSVPVKEVPVLPQPITCRQTSGLTSSSFATTNASSGEDHYNNRNNSMTIDDDMDHMYRAMNDDDHNFGHDEGVAIKSQLSESTPSDWSCLQQNSSNQSPHTSNNISSSPNNQNESTGSSGTTSMNSTPFCGENCKTTSSGSDYSCNDNSHSNTTGNKTTVSSPPVLVSTNDSNRITNSTNYTKRSNSSSRRRVIGSASPRRTTSTGIESLVLHRQSSTTTSTSSIGNINNNYTTGSASMLLPPLVLHSSNSRRSILSWGSNFTGGTKKSSQFSIKTSTSSKTGIKSTGAAELEWLYNHSHNKWTSSTASFSRQSSIASAATSSSSFGVGMVNTSTLVSTISKEQNQQQQHHHSRSHKDRPSTPPDLIRNITNATVRQIQMSSSSSSAASPEQVPALPTEQHTSFSPYRYRKKEEEKQDRNERKKKKNNKDQYKRPNNPIAFQMMKEYDSNEQHQIHEQHPKNSHDDSFHSYTSTTTDLLFMTTDSVGSI